MPSNCRKCFDFAILQIFLKTLRYFSKWFTHVGFQKWTLPPTTLPWHQVPSWRYFRRSWTAPEVFPPLEGDCIITLHADPCWQGGEMSTVTPATGQTNIESSCAAHTHRPYQFPARRAQTLPQQRQKTHVTPFLTTGCCWVTHAQEDTAASKGLTGVSCC